MNSADDVERAERRSEDRLKRDRENGMDSGTERSGTYQAFNIDMMISQETDTKQRVYLLILQNINNSLIANTSLTRTLVGDLKKLSTSLDDHQQEHENLVNKAKGAKMMLPLLGIAGSLIQGLIIYLWLQNGTAIDTIGRDIAIGKIAQAEMRHDIDINLEKHNQLESRVTKIENSVRGAK